ncbi:hypothetical protein E5676_scaffold142G00570 [Cucumis melo var. makuwa]|uniref:Uncharacterized protein n=1 Tax=Cucumis melo var. makuwa TaxID=1194695 RepID=A0A5D3DIK6_CUCMM|nr:hypothetical protein E5676_scaffold142G00570 [Cucumis melo var. makuwa]
MHLPCDEPKRRERKVNDVLTFVDLNFFFGPKLLLFLKITSKDNHQADLLCSGPRTELWDSVIRREFLREMRVNRLGVILEKTSSFSHLVQPINQNPSRVNEKVGPLVQGLDSVLKGTTYLLSQKWVGVNSILHAMSLAIHSVFLLKWEAYWASDVELPSPMQI